MLYSIIANICARCINRYNQIENRVSCLQNLAKPQGLHHTHPATGGERIGAMQLLAAARHTQLSSVFVAEVQTEATLMLGAMDEDKIRPQ